MKKVKLLIRKDFTKNVATLFTGNGFAQLFNIVGTLLVYPQIYSPTDFGYLAIFMSISMILSTPSTGRYEQAIVLPKEPSKGLNLLILSILILSFFSAVLFILIFTLQRTCSDLPYIKDLGELSLLIPFSVLFFGLFQSLNLWMVRNRKFKVISVSKITESAVSFIVTVVLGLVFSFNFGLIIGFVLGQLFSSLILLFFFIKEFGPFVPAIKKSELLEVLLQYKDFPRFNMTQVLFDMFQKYGSVFIIEHFFGYRILGNYHLVYRVLRGPLALFGGSFAQVFYQKATDYFNSGKNYYWLLKKSLLGLSVLSMPMFGLLFFFIKPLFSSILGPEYNEAGTIAVILIPWMAFNFISSPISALPIILNKQKMFLIITTIGNVLGMSILFILSYQGFGYKISLLGFSISMMIQMIVIIIWNLLETRISYNSVDAG